MNINDKAATSVSNLNHRISQWLFLSKRKKIQPADGFNIDGWYLDIYTEKCKSAPSGFTITCVFDKLVGLHKFWSEYEFLSDYCPSEKKFYKGDPPVPLNIISSGPSNKLRVLDPQSGAKLYESDSFYKKNALYLYNTDANFKQWFDYAMDTAVYTRIVEGLFRLATNYEELGEVTTSVPMLETAEEQLVNNILGPDAPEREPIFDTIPDEKLIQTADEKGELYQSIF